MKTILLKTVILRMLVLSVRNVSETKMKILLPKPAAAKECARSGTTLLNFMEVQENPSNQEFLEQLETGQTAWIDGYAEFSPFLWSEGCYLFTNTKYETKIDMTNKSLFTCLKECSFYHITVFGVQNTTCYCFLNNMFQTQELVEPALCNISCDYNVIDSCGGDSYLALYSFYSDDVIHWGENEPSNKQCVYIKRKHPQPEAYTASCHSFSAGGYVCTDALHCGRSFFNLCINGGTVTWQEAYKGCLNKNGVHSEWIGLINYGRGLKYNHNYWFGPYRTFKASETAIGNKTVCLSATRSNNTLFMETDDCSEKRYPMCKPNILQRVRTKLGSEVNMASMANQSGSFNIISGQSNTKRTGSITEYVPHLLSGFALLLSLIVIIAVCRLQALLKRKVFRLHSSSETGEIYITL